MSIPMWTTIQFFLLIQMGRRPKRERVERSADIGYNESHRIRKDRWCYVPVRPGTVAISPEQWGGKAAVRPFISRIRGRSSLVQFNGITATIGSKVVPLVREKLQNDSPGMLIIELMSLKRVPKYIQLMTICVPKEMPCPDLSVEEK